MKKYVLIILFSVFCLLKINAQPAKSFTVFDNLHYAEKPDTATFGIANCNIIYGHLWPAPKRIKTTAPTVPGDSQLNDDAPLPNALMEPAFKAEAEKCGQKPGPIVLDFEAHQLSGKPELVLPHFAAYESLVRWTKEAAPGHLVGYYGHGLFPEQPGKRYQAEAAKLADLVDAFFPSMYVFGDDRAAWQKKAAALVAQAHRLAPGKPVCFYLWPQYHEGSPKALQFVSGDYWLWQLETARKVGADGVVMWSSNSPAWNPEAEWWQATLKFLKEVKTP